MIPDTVYDKIKNGNFFVTSDTHFGHKNIIKYCDRPFKDADYMDEVMIERWNSEVKSDDVVLHLGDAAMGDITKSLTKISKLNGFKILVVGNHDRIFSKIHKDKIMQWIPKYEEVFQHLISDDGVEWTVNGVKFRFNHFPYTGDHTPEDRHADMRPVDDGMPLIHGHTHSPERLSESHRGTQQIHVGVDAWGFYPVHWSRVLEEMGVYY